MLGGFFMRIVSGEWDITLGSRLIVRKGGQSYAPRMGNAARWGGKNPDLRKDLSTGEHNSPPDGYPKDRNQYAVPEFYLFPINNEEKTRAAIDYFSHHAWKPKEHKEEAARRILRSAKKFGIKVSKDSDVVRAAGAGKAGGFAHGLW
jgi:hypothetical protein